ncbi:MAG: ABC transporter ATP-binding protein [Bacteroidetes bacterium]|nr:ABC transporter ATP-binding protein [Bacteroidota bacterium]
MEENQALVVENLNVLFDDKPALHGLSFSLSAGKTLALVGESGSGKSLCALAVMGLLPSQASWMGRIHLGSKKCSESSTAADWRYLRGKVASIVFQEPMSALNPVMKVGRQIAECLRVHAGLGPAAAKKQAQEWLRKVQIPTPEKSYHKYPHQLSGGQKQRVMIAMALSTQPLLLIADEPTTALDVTIQQEVIRLMRQLQTECGAALMFITHDLALAAEIADEVLVLRAGKVVEQGPVQQVLHTPAQPYTQALLACRPSAAQKGFRLPVVADFLENNGQTPARIPIVQEQNARLPEALLKVRNLRVWFPVERDWTGTPIHFLRAVEDVSFDLNRGEVLGLVGESGCGKSTISRALMGLQEVESGHIHYEGRDLVRLNSAGWRRMRREVQMIFQDPYSSLNPRLTVGDALMEPLRVHSIVPRRLLQQEALRLLDWVHLPADSMHRYPHQFSGGQRQRIGIARAIALRPKLIICDESVSALDVSVQAQVLNLLKELQAALKLSYLFISHDLNVVSYIADSVLVMQAGKIVERGKAQEVFEHPRDPYTRRLVEASVY